MKERNSSTAIGAWIAPTPVLSAILICIVGQGAIAQSRQQAQNGRWKIRKSMPAGAVFAGTVLGLDARIYVISGSTGYDSPRTNAVHVYQPHQDSWSDVSPIPTPRTEPGAAAGPDGKIYVMGGADAEHKKNVLEAYDPKTDSWSRLTPMPTPRESLSAVAAKGADGRIRLYAIGGRDRAKPGNGLSTVEAYDPLTDTWTSLAPMPTHRHAQAATLGPDGCIYVLGGTNDTVSSTPLMEIYDPRRDVWTKGPPMPYGQECAAATFTVGKAGEVLVFGGWDSLKRPLHSAVAFDPRTKKWRFLPAPTLARAAGGAVCWSGRDGAIHVCVIGGTGEYGDGQIRCGPLVETTVEEYVLRPTPRSK